MHFSPTVLSEPEQALRDEVRAFLRATLVRGSYRPALGDNFISSPEFSIALAEQGWVGMAIPVEYGGHGRSAVDRFVVAEELLAAGAPVAAHWVADRQTAPTLLAFGSEEQRRRFLPPIARGRCYFSIGMSEPGAGSDLASVASNARKVPGGWLLNGTKIWTGGAHRNHYFCVLCRTSEVVEDRHNGLSQLIVDLSSPGITITPIPLLDGTHLFNEVVLSDVFVPDDLVLGEVGMGWHQVTSELAYERSGPDRYLSSYQVLETYVAERLGSDPPSDVAERIGALAARLWSIRQCSFSVARSIEAGHPSAIQTSIVKDIGTLFEQEVVATLQELLDDDPDPAGASLFESLLAQAMLLSPAFTIRGGTTEILRTVAALSGRRVTELDEARLDALFAAHSTPEARHSVEAEGWAGELWGACAAAGVASWAGARSEGAERALADAAVLCRVAGRHAASVPVAEATLLGGWLADVAGLALPGGPITVAAPRESGAVALERSGSGYLLSGRFERVPYGRFAASLVALVNCDGALHVLLVDPASSSLTPGGNVAGEPRDVLEFDHVPLTSDVAVAVPDAVGWELELRGALSRALLMSGAMESVAAMTVAYADGRRQFGRAVSTFQAVANRLVRLASETELAMLAATVAARAFGAAGVEAAFEVAAAKATASRSAGEVAAHAHQVHGAIGMTGGYPLHHLTRRLWVWRQEWGSARRWTRYLGEHVGRSGADELWPTVAREI